MRQKLSHSTIAIAKWREKFISLNFPKVFDALLTVEKKTVAKFFSDKHLRKVSFEKSLGVRPPLQSVSYRWATEADEN